MDITRLFNNDKLTPSDSIILLRRAFVADFNDGEGVDLLNGGTSEKRRVCLGGVDRNNVLTLNLSMSFLSF